MIIARIEDRLFITGERLLPARSDVSDARHLTFHDGGARLRIRAQHEPRKWPGAGRRSRNTGRTRRYCRGLDADSPRVIALMHDGTKYIDPHPGMTADDVISGWRDIEPCNFDAHSDER